MILRIRPKGEKVFNIVNIIFMISLSLAFVFPLFYIYVSSITSEAELMKNSFAIWPDEISFNAYSFIFSPGNKVIPGAMLSVATTVIGTIQSILVICLFGYAMAKDRFPFKKIIMAIVVFTMVFNGGLIPTFLLMKDLRLLNTFYMLIIFHAFNAGNMVFMRNYFMSIPRSIGESARIDGANEYIILSRIIIPISKPMIACVILFAAVGIWNDWTTALFYNPAYPVEPLQLVLKKVMTKIDEILMTKMNLGAMGRFIPSEGIKYATVVVVVTPILCMYPFLQKYFIKGSWIGGVKE